MKEKLKKLMEGIKRFLSNKTNRITAIILQGRSKERFVLDHIYDVYPEEVRKLYSNFVDASCNGDLHFDITIDAGEVKLDKLDKNNLLDYLFSNLDKEGVLKDGIEPNEIKSAEKKLFADYLNLNKDLDSFNYKESTYKLTDGKYKKTKNECTSDTKNILHLYGYFWNKDVLSIDINVAYLKDGKLYNYDNEELGDYDGDTTKLSNLTEHTSYYRVNYTKDGGILKLSSVEWKHRS